MLVARPHQHASHSQRWNAGLQWGRSSTQRAWQGGTAELSEMETRVTHRARPHNSSNTDRRAPTLPALSSTFWPNQLTLCLASWPLSSALSPASLPPRACHQQASQDQVR